MEQSNFNALEHLDCSDTLLRNLENRKSLKTNFKVSFKFFSLPVYFLGKGFKAHLESSINI